MKKILRILAAVLLFPAFFVSCDGKNIFSESYTFTLSGIKVTLDEPCTYFKGYDDFEKVRTAWQEPESYSFVYRWCWGDYFVLWPLKVTVKDGEASFDVTDYERDWNGLYKTEEEIAKEKAHVISEYEDAEVLFPSITAIYDFVENYYQEILEESETSGKYSVFVAKFDSLSDGTEFLSLFDELQDAFTDKTGMDGYGGAYLVISDLEIE